MVMVVFASISVPLKTMKQRCTCSYSSSLKPNPPPLMNITELSWRRKSKKKRHCTLQVSATTQNSFNKFIQFALNKTKLHTAHLLPFQLQDKYSSVLAIDGKTELQMASFEAPKVRLLRSLSIENEAMQVMDFGVFSEPEFDIPFFCANFFSTASMNIIVLDLNPLQDVIAQRDYRGKYYRSLMPLGLKYSEISCSFYLGEESSQASP